MDFILRPLPYPENALEPVIGRETVHAHDREHHLGHLDELRSLIAGEPESKLELDDPVRVSEGAVFDCAAEIWNHDFYWRSLKPGGSRPSRAFARLIEQDFGSFDKLREQFLSAGASHLGSGWIWLVLGGAGLEVLDTHDAACALNVRGVPLLCVDLWEHAYYLDRRSDRAGYLEATFDGLLNWNFAENNARRTGLVEV
jgi:Fe-Mn family superoxide dismutase